MDAISFMIQAPELYKKVTGFFNKHKHPFILYLCLKLGHTFCLGIHRGAKTLIPMTLLILAKLGHSGGQANWAKMTSTGDKLTGLACHPTKKVNKAE